MSRYHIKKQINRKKKVLFKILFSGILFLISAIGIIGFILSFYEGGEEVNLADIGLLEMVIYILLSLCLIYFFAWMLLDMLITTGFPGSIMWIVLILISGGVFTTIHYAVSYFPRLIKEYFSIKNQTEEIE